MGPTLDETRIEGIFSDIPFRRVLPQIPERFADPLDRQSPFRSSSHILGVGSYVCTGLPRIRRFGCKRPKRAATGASLRIRTVARRVDCDPGVSLSALPASSEI